MRTLKLTNNKLLILFLFLIAACSSNIDSDPEDQFEKSDSEITISTTQTSMYEGNTDLSELSITVSLSRESTDTISVNYETEDGTAIEGEDYEGQTGELVFDPGRTEHTIVINVYGDLQFEADETLSILLSDATNAAIDNLNNTTTILNDDFDPVKVNKFSRTLYTIFLRENCRNCHQVNGFAESFGVFADGNIYTAYGSTINYIDPVADKSERDLSLMVTEVADGHHCWSNCMANANEIVSYIDSWAQLEDQQ